MTDDIDFKNANLSCADLSRMNLSGANFQGANLNGANLTASKLSGANFSQASLEGTKLDQALLTGATFDSASLTGTNLTGALLTPATPGSLAEPDALTETQQPNQAYDKLKQMAFYDPMTGAYNRQAFEDLLAQESSNMQRYQYNSALLFIDLDHFKSINDEYGHATGDHLLKEVVLRLKTMVRKGDIIARLGGDEFVVYLKNIRNALDLGNIAQNTVRGLSEKFYLDDTNISISASIGICYWSKDSQLKLKDVLSRADIALYRVKSRGRNGYQYYSADLHRQHILHKQLNHEIEKAIKEDQLTLHFESIHYSEGNGLLGYEAIFRWKNSESKLVSFRRIRQSAETTGVVQHLGKSLLSRSLKHFQSMQKQNASHDSLQLFINFSPQQLTDDTFLDSLTMIAKENDISLNQINIAIDEKYFLRYNKKLMVVLKKIVDMNVSVALDQFTCDNWSFLKSEKPLYDKIKLADCHAKDLITASHNNLLLQCTIQLLHSMGLTCIAKISQSDDAIEKLKALQCDALQQYGDECEVMLGND